MAAEPASSSFSQLATTLAASPFGTFVGTGAIILGLLTAASAGGVVPAMLFHATWDALDPFRSIPVWTLSPVGNLTMESRAERVLLWVTVALAVAAFIGRRRRSSAHG